MELKDKLKDLFEEQKYVLGQYEKIINDCNLNDIANQNAEFKKEIENYKKVLQETKDQYQKILDENQELRTALREQILDEKLNILKISKEKLDIYFKNLTAEYNNKLLALEEASRLQIEKLNNISLRELGEQSDEINKKIMALSGELQQKIQEKRDEYKASKQEILTGLKDQYDKLAEEEIDEETLKKRIKRNNMEIKIGLSWINKIGIFLILIGVASFMKYGYYEWLAPHMKGIFAFVIGGLFLMAGELFNRKEKTTFGKGLTGGGIAILYYAIFNAYFVFKIINMEVGLLLSILVTVVALVLSLYNNSKTICAFALIGGYLPFFAYGFAFGFNDQIIYMAMGYLFILNLLIMAVSTKRGWNVTNYISFVLNVPTLAYLVFETSNHMSGLLYSFLTFTMYLIITLIYPFRNKISLKVPDAVLLGLNTFISCVITYSLFERAGFNNLKGFLALVFCGVYFGLGQFIDKYLSQEKVTKGLFYLTSLTFAILMIPFQFGIEWLAMGWFVEGSLLIVYGYKNKLSNVEKSGWGIFLLCIGAFLTVDAMSELSPGFNIIKHFDFKYFVITFGTLAIMFMYMIDMNKNLIARYTDRGDALTYYKYLTLINLWIYATYTSGKLYDKYINLENLNDYFGYLVFALATILVGFILSKIDVIKDKFVEWYSIILYIIADIICLALNFDTPVLRPELLDNTKVEIFAIIILVLFNVFVFFNIRDIIIHFIREQNSSLEIYPLLMGLYLVGNLTGFLIVQFRLGDENLLFSVIYMVLALAFIIYGFMQRYVMIRRFGLGLSIFATAKLFIYDLSYLETIGRIIAYFCFGFVMLGISYVYQRVSSSIEEKQKLMKY